MKRFSQIGILLSLFSIISFAQWENQNPVPAGNYLKSVFFIDDNRGWICGNGIILRTTNAGEKWISQSVSANLKSIHFVDLQNGWAAGKDGVILKTIDGGNDWFQVNSGVTEILNNIRFVNGNTGWVFGNNGKILKTNDGGNTWLPQNSGTICNIYSSDFITQDLGWAVGGIPDDTTIILHTTNGGNNWIQQSCPINNNNQLRSVDFVDANIGWAAGGDYLFGITILKTTDGGNNWFDYSSHFVVPEELKNKNKTDFKNPLIQNDYDEDWGGIQSIFFKDLYNGFAVWGNTDFYSGIISTTNGGETWEGNYYRRCNIWIDLFFRSIYVTQNGRGWAVGGDGFILFKDYDDPSFTEQLSGPKDNIHSVQFINENVGWATGERINVCEYADGEIYKTTNAGKIWTNQHFISNEKPMLEYFVDENTGWVCTGEDGTLYSTIDGGENWQFLTHMFGIASLFFLNESIGFCTNGEGIMKTTDAGMTWELISTFSGNSIYFVDAINGWIAGPGGIILKTTDLGENWISQISGSTTNLNSIKFYSSNLGICVGTSGTILLSTDGGTNWVLKNSGTASNLNSVTFGNLTTAWIAGDNGTILQTTDSGNNWTLFNNVTTNSLTSVTAVNETNAWFSGTNGTIIKYSALPTTFQLSVSVMNGWNMVSVPGINPDGQSIDSWWSGRDPASNVYKFDGSYQSVNMVEPGKGYWIKNLGDQTYGTGDEWPASGIEVVPHNPLNGTAGWNMIGGYEYNAAVSGITTTPPGLRDSPVYGYSNGYQIEDYLIPGYGYWIKLSDNGLINLPDQGIQISDKTREYINDGWGKITITDNDGRSSTLYAIKNESDIDLNQYELPPLPPSEIFDVRFGSSRVAEDINSDFKAIEMQGLVYPVKLKVENIDITIQDITGKLINTNIKSGGEITIGNPNIDKLMVSGQALPVKFSLEQNYPNPFNPNTTIKFSTPKETSVNLSVYNILGERLKELKNEVMKSGYYEAEFNAAALASGVYFYRIKAGDFIQTKKMVLLR